MKCETAIEEMPTKDALEEVFKTFQVNMKDSEANGNLSDKELAKKIIALIEDALDREMVDSSIVVDLLFELEAKYQV